MLCLCSHDLDLHGADSKCRVWNCRCTVFDNPDAPVTKSPEVLAQRRALWSGLKPPEDLTHLELIHAYRTVCLSLGDPGWANARVRDDKGRELDLANAYEFEILRRLNDNPHNH